MICWSCEREVGGDPACPRCGALQPPDRQADYFAVLGLPSRHYAIDLAAAEAAYKRLSRQLHPDRFAKADPRARRASLERTVQLNDAWRTLRDPVRRAEYLLRLCGVDVGAESETTSSSGDGASKTRRLAAPPAFLMEVLELHDELRAAQRTGDAQAIARMVADMRGRADGEMRAIAEALEQPTPESLNAAAGALVALRYYQRFLNEATEEERRVPAAPRLDEEPAHG